MLIYVHDSFVIEFEIINNANDMQLIKMLC